MTATYWLDGEGARRGGPASVLVGRSPDCDVVIDDLRVSRHHALFRMTEDGVEVIPFGREPVTVNGEPCIKADDAAPGRPGGLRGARLHHRARAPPRRRRRPRCCGRRADEGRALPRDGRHLPRRGAPDDQLVDRGGRRRCSRSTRWATGWRIEALREAWAGRATRRSRRGVRPHRAQHPRGLLMGRSSAWWRCWATR